MADQIQNTIVEIGAIEETKIQVKLRDVNKRSLGSFFKNKKDGDYTQAFNQFNDMEIKSGSIVEVSFKEVPYKDGTIKNIIGFREAGGRPVIKTPTKMGLDLDTGRIEHFDEPMPEEYPTPKGLEPQDKFGRRLALHGFVNARLQNHTIAIVKTEIDELLELEDYINSKL